MLGWELLKVLYTGAAGQLGYDVVAEMRRRNIDCLGVDRNDFDITDTNATQKFIVAYHPDVVLHCAGYTAVDAAEDDVDLCRKINVDGTANIVKACKAIDAKMVYISTDYVFPGTGDKPYEVDDVTAPCNVYGKSKLDGESIVRSEVDKYFIVRISWLFGSQGKNFVDTMLRLGMERKELTVVDDQIGSPTYTVDLARLLCDMIMTDKYGVYHATNEGFCSWAEFAREIMRGVGLSCRIVAVSSGQYFTKAIRPKNSRLSKESLDRSGFNRLPNWKDALNRFLVNMKGEL